MNPVADAIVAREFPEVAAAGRFFKPREHDATFALGLEILVAEIERRRIVLSKRGGKAARG